MAALPAFRTGSRGPRMKRPLPDPDASRAVLRTGWVFRPDRIEWPWPSPCRRGIRPAGASAPAQGGGRERRSTFRRPSRVSPSGMAADPAGAPAAIAAADALAARTGGLGPGAWQTSSRGRDVSRGTAPPTCFRSSLRPTALSGPASAWTAPRHGRGPLRCGEPRAGCGAAGFRAGSRERGAVSASLPLTELASADALPHERAL